MHFLVDNVQQLDRIGQRLISPGVFSIFFVFFLRFPILIFPCALLPARRGTPVPPERSRPRTMQSPWHLRRGKEVREPRAAYRSEKARSLPSAYDADRALILARAPHGRRKEEIIDEKEFPQCFMMVSECSNFKRLFITKYDIIRCYMVIYDDT